MNEGIYTSVALIVAGFFLTITGISMISSYPLGSIVLFVFGLPSLGLGIIMILKSL